MALLELFAPTQGSFLAVDAVDASLFRPAQKSFIRIRLAMFAEGLGEVEAAGSWSDAALSVAETIPEAQKIRALASLSIAPALLRGEYRRAAQLACLMANADIEGVDEGSRAGPSGAPATQSAVAQISPKAAFAMMLFAVPSTTKLASLQSGDTSGHLDVAGVVEDISAVLGGTPGTEPIIEAMRTVLLDREIDCKELRRRADAMVPGVETFAAGLVYVVGCAFRCELPEALFMQVWFLREVEKLFSIHRSLRQEIIYPFFKKFWSAALSECAHQFRTSEAYTRQCIESAEPSSKALKGLLKSMAFCLGMKLPSDMEDWLGSS